MREIIFPSGEFLRKLIIFSGGFCVEFCVGESKIFRVKLCGEKKF